MTSNPAEKRPRLERSAGLAASAELASQRFGAPLSVMDPLLSLLFDVRRLEQRVIAALGEIGVDRARLPPPFAERHGGASSPPDAPSPTEDTRSGVVQDAISLYAELSSPAAPPDRTIVVEAVLRWLDDAAPASEAAARQGSDDERQASRGVLAGLIAAGGEEGDRPIIAAHGPPLPAPFPGPTGKNQVDREAALRFVEADSLPSGEDHGLTLLGSFDAGTVESWGRYADGLSLAIAEMHPLLHSLCSTTIAGTLSSHAKWIEVSMDEMAHQTPVPSCAAAKQNYEELIQVNDSLATCQAAMRNCFLAFEDAAERYTGEAAVATRYERQYWQHIRKFESEYNALRAIKRGLSQVQKAFRREEGVPIPSSCKNFIVAKAATEGKAVGY